MPGPLPTGNARRRNAPTIPTTSLPASGPDFDPPDVPEAYDLHEAGLAWWNWAWRLPQACAWDDGALYAIARRAQLEDDLAVLREDDSWYADLHDFLGVADDELVKRIAEVMGRLKRLAGNEVSVMKEMRELDNRLGLNPQALAALRWKIVDDSDKKPESKDAKKDKPKTERRLRVVDPAA